MKDLILKISILILLSIMVKAEQLEVNLIDFAIFASEANKKNILVDENLRNENVVFIINDSEDFLLEAFEKAVNLKGLELIEHKNFYYVQKSIESNSTEIEKYRTIKLDFVNFEDIENLLKVYAIKYEFIKTSKTLLIKSNESEFNSINALIKELDKLPLQLKLKITIIEADITKVKEIGTDSSYLNLANDTNLFFNLITYPFNVTNVIPQNQSKGFYSFLKFLNQDKLVSIHSNPILSLSDNKEIIFDSVSNLPFKTGTTNLEETVSRTMTSVDYKDVGTVIKIKPTIYSSNNVYLDIDINISNIVTNNDMYPITNKKALKQFINLKVGSLYFLTGINKKDFRTTNNAIPFLSDIPFLGNLFKYENKSLEDTNLTIVFELIEDSYLSSLALENNIKF